MNYRKSINKCFDEKHIWFIFHQICEGLKHLHENGIVHRDLKSMNIICHRGGRIFKIGNFSIIYSLFISYAIRYRWFGSESTSQRGHHNAKYFLWHASIFIAWIGWKSTLQWEDRHLELRNHFVWNGLFATTFSRCKNSFFL